MYDVQVLRGVVLRNNLHLQIRHEFRTRSDEHSPDDVGICLGFFDGFGQNAHFTACLRVIAIIVYIFLTRDVFAVGVSTSSIIGGRQFIIICFTSFFMSVVRKD